MTNGKGAIHQLIEAELNYIKPPRKIPTRSMGLRINTDAFDRLEKMAGRLNLSTHALAQKMIHAAIEEAEAALTEVEK